MHRHAIYGFIINCFRTKTRHTIAQKNSYKILLLLNEYCIAYIVNENLKALRTLLRIPKFTLHVLVYYKTL